MEQRWVQWMQSMDYNDYSYETWTHMDEVYDEIYDLSIEHFAVVFVLSCFTRGFFSQSSGDTAKFDLENLKTTNLTWQCRLRSIVLDEVQ